MLDPPPDTPSSSSSSSCLRPAASQTAKEKLQIVQQRARIKNYISQVITYFNENVKLIKSFVSDVFVENLQNMLITICMYLVLVIIIQINFSGRISLFIN